jgi:hypothetical protein
MLFQQEQEVQVIFVDYLLLVSWKAIRLRRKQVDVRFGLKGKLIIKYINMDLCRTGIAPFFYFNHRTFDLHINKLLLY